MLQTILVLTAIALALGYLAARAYRTARAVKQHEAGCGSDCGCGDTATESLEGKSSRTPASATAKGRG